MADKLEPIGVEAIAKGVGGFLQSMKQMEDAFDRTSKKLDGFAPATTQATGGTQKLGGAISSLLPSLSGAAGGVGGVVSALGPLAVKAGAALGGLYLLKKGFDALIGAIKSAISAMTDFMGKGMQWAGTFQEMELAALAIGRAMGLQESAIRSAIDGVEDAGIRYDIAARSVALLARNQIDLTKAQELANRAQAAGILFGRGSTEAMEDLTTAIATGSTVRLRTLGVTEDMSVFEERYAKSIGKTVEQLTQQEQMTARVDGVLQSLSSTMDVYDAVMESPTKRLRSLAERELPTLQAALGGPFLNAWATIIGTSDTGIRGFVNALTDAMREGGSLYPILVKLGAIADFLAEGFANAIQIVTDFVTNLRVDLGEGMGKTASDMLRWGAEIVASLATGIINAASTVLVTAMNAISSVLTFWLGAASAPRVAPGLLKWGVAAMSEFLHGMTEADFSVLEKIQAPLKQVLSGKQFAAISAEMIKALSEGAFDETMFTRIEEAAGAFGTEIARLARLQYDLAMANQAVADSERRVEEGRKKVSDLTAEYNQMVRAGADPAALKAKLAELNAAEEGLDVAKAQRTEAKERIGSLEEEAKLQEKLVGQLIGLAQAAAPPVAAAPAAAAAKMPKAAKVKAEDLIPELTLPTPADFDIKSVLSEAVKQAKEAMRTELADVFQPLTDAWENMKTGPLSEIVPAFQTMWGLVQQTWDDFWAGFSLGWGDMDSVFQKFITEVKPALADAWQALGDLWAEIADILGLDETNWGNLVTKLGEFAGSSAAQFLTDFLEATVTGLEDFAEAVDWVSERVGVWNGILDNLRTALSQLELGEILSLSTILGAIDVPDWLRPGSITPFESGIRGITGAVGELIPAVEGFFGFQKMKEDLTLLVMETIPLFINSTVLEFLRLKTEILLHVDELVRRMIQRFTEMKNRVVAIFRSMFSTILAAMKEFLEVAAEILEEIAVMFEDWAQRLGKAMEGIINYFDQIISKVQALIRALENLYEMQQKTGQVPGSPSRWEVALMGVSKAMQKMASVDLPRLSAAMAPLPAYAPAPAMAGATTTTTSVTVPIGPVYISGPMDMADFQIKTEQVVYRAVYGRP